MSDTRLAGLRRFNLWMAGLHGLQAVVVLALATDFSLPIRAGFLRPDPAGGSLIPAAKTLFEVPLAWLVAAFFLMSSTAHLSIATVYRRSYERDLERGMNRARWFEYSLSAGTMMVAVAMLVGVYDLASLLMIFALTALMNLMGLMMEVHNQATERTNWLSFRLGILAGAVPWVVVALYLWVGASEGSRPPTFVYWIFGSIFLFFNCFAVNMYLQYRGIGRWRDYLYGERVYIVLSLTAKSALAWQVFAGTLRP